MHMSKFIQMYTLNSCNFLYSSYNNKSLKKKKFYINEKGEKSDSQSESVVNADRQQDDPEISNKDFDKWDLKKNART